MLQRLYIQNVGLIRSAVLDGRGGLTTVTGETGAGKSMFIDALSLALGERAEQGLLRVSADGSAAEAVVEATFALSDEHPAAVLLEEFGASLEEGELTLRRMLSTDKSRAFANGLRLTQVQMKELGAHLVDIHGQYDNQALLRTTQHGAFLDRFGGLQASRAAVEGAYKAWKAAAEAVAAAEDKLLHRGREEALLRSFAEELTVLAPETGEEERLTVERRQLMSFERLGEALRQAQSVLGGDEFDVSAALGRAEDALLRVGSELGTPADEGAEREADALPARVAGLAARVGSVTAELKDLSWDVERLASDLRSDPERLAAVDERLSVLRDAARKHRVTADELPALHAKFLADLAGLETLQEDMAHLQDAERAARLAFEAACGVLSVARQGCASGLSAAVEEALKGLEMPYAKFEAAVRTLPAEQWGQAGAEAVEFMISVNPGSPLLPLAKVASGGEVSRLMLALKQVFYRTMPSTVLVFDEVDTGVGGKVADAIGLSMKELSRQHQVFAITHLPQVAARGEVQLKIEKTVSADGADTETHVRILAADERTAEIARMLSGRDVSAAALAAAESLLVG